MGEVMKLKLVEAPEVPSDKDYLLAKFDDHIKGMREWLEKTESGGFVLIAYDKTESGAHPEVHSWVNTFTSEPADGFWLPDMVKTRVYQRIHDND